MYHILLFSVCTCVFAGKYAVGMHVEIRGQHTRVSSCLPCELQDQTQLVRHGGNQVSLQSCLTSPMQKYYTRFCFYVTSKACVGLCRLFSC